MPAKPNSEELEGTASKLACKGISAPPLTPPQMPRLPAARQGGLPLSGALPYIAFCHWRDGVALLATEPAAFGFIT